ncbi:ParB/RepB/Spo0J family partition protein [Gammaproteobacteria bacterium]|nr:ParB/RepB/Spo0J family partition protein [Gammaproteobacteria bacterium]
MSKKRLGKGLDALLGDLQQSPAAAAARAAASDDGPYRDLAIDQLERGRYQPRSVMDQAALEELSASITAQGIVQPIVARKLGENRYEIIAGERRWRAAKLAGLAVVPVILREVPEESVMAMALIENIQREDLNPVEEATALRRLMDEFNMTHQQVADTVGRSRSAVTNLMRLLSLTPRVRQFLEEGEIEMGHARALLPIEGDAQEQVAISVIQKGLNVRATEALVKKIQQGEEKAAPVRAEPSADLKRLINDLSESIGARVDIQHGKKKGKLLIEYHSLDQLDGLIERIRGGA